MSTISRPDGGSVQWMSPELLDPESFGLNDCSPTEKSDCYALGMVIYEVLSGQLPYGLDKGIVVSRKVVGGKRPGRPLGTRAAWFTDGLWETLELCWNHQPRDRPDLKTLLQRLEGATQVLRSPPLTAANQGIVADTDNLPDRTVTNLGMVSTSLAAADVRQLETGGFDPDKPPLPYPYSVVIPSTPRTQPQPPTPSKPSLAQPNIPRISQ